MSEQYATAETVKQFMKDGDSLFCSKPPRNTSSTVQGSNTCAQCSRPATFRCSACPIADSDFYCSQKCQKRNWREHKNYCRSKQLYAAMRSLNVPHDFTGPITDEMQMHLSFSYRTAKIFPTPEFIMYFKNIPSSKRPVTMIGPPHGGRPIELVGLKQQVKEDIRKLRPTTPQQHEERVRPFIVPGKQTWMEYGKTPFMNRSANVCHNGERGILLCPSDYDYITIGMWEELWGSGMVVMYDPWK